MPYEVLNDFIENEHKGLRYQKGELYPKTGFEADTERVAFLQEKHEKYKKVFLGPELEPKVNETVDDSKEIESEEKSKQKKSTSKTKADK
ncbi:hypothetical protein [Niallia nealsonii]|uniref:Uncharacterized protein n=1 Tax=Niallia nealsonii TaxID=115979 RepID=A0A2N0Z356_9BACI|nr:hypothetical protein [Niallia nealsonii]PKG23942.1 hypothetical protein CWS01_09230 [Niallia nealsonii]